MLSGVLLVASGCAAEGTQQAPVTLADLGVQAEFGSEYPRGDTGLAVLQRVSDGVIIGDSIALLDVAAPYVRIFDSSGKFVRAIVQHGEGPGEAKTPLSLEGHGERDLLLTQPKQLSVIDLNGAVRRSVPSPAGVMRGAAGCGERLIILHTSRDGFSPQGALTVLDDSVPTTLVMLDTLRGSTHGEHPAYFGSTERALAVYTEETRRPRLLQIDCATSRLQGVRIDSVGPPEWWEAGPGGQWALHPSQPPFPAGVARLAEGIVWATQAVRSASTGSDSVTVIDLISSDAPRRRLILRGWYELLDSDRSGRMLWAMQDDDRGDRALIIEASALVKALRDYGMAADRKEP